MNVRQEPNTRAAVLTQALQGSAVNVVAIVGNDAWVKTDQGNYLAASVNGQTFLS
jgi:hypothetical protein